MLYTRNDLCCNGCRVGQVVVKGSIKSLSVTGTGVSKVYVQGSLGTVNVQLTGVSEAHLDSTSGKTPVRYVEGCTLPVHTRCALLCIFGL